MGAVTTTERRPSKRGAEARVALVAAAERLFAEHGTAGVSLRDVSAAAGQRNHYAAQYHFGDRKGLVAAVYVAHMSVVDARRRAMLDELPGDDDVAALVRALIVPLVEEVVATEGWYARFLLRSRWDPLAVEVVAGLDVTGALVGILRRLAPALTHLPPRIRRSRLDQVLSLVIATLADWEWAHDRGQPRLSVRDLVAELTTTGTAVLLAPTS